jgi:hypothetical protein
MAVSRRIQKRTVEMVSGNANEVFLERRGVEFTLWAAAGESGVRELFIQGVWYA